MLTYHGRFGLKLTGKTYRFQRYLIICYLSILDAFFLGLIAFKTYFFLSYFQSRVLSSFFPPQDCEGLIVLNIGSYMGGVDLWQNDYEHDDDFSLQSMQDKMVEVVSVCGAWHLGKLQVCQFLKIGSCSSFALCV